MKTSIETRINFRKADRCAVCKFFHLFYMWGCQVPVCDNFSIDRKGNLMFDFSNYVCDVFEPKRERGKDET